MRTSSLKRATPLLRQACALALLGAVAWGCGGGEGGGSIGELIADEQDAPSALATDAQNVYWVNSGPPGTLGSFMKAPKAGGKPTVLFTGTSERGRPGFVALVGADALLHVSDANFRSYLMKVPLAGGPAVELFQSAEQMVVYPSQGALYLLAGVEPATLQKLTPPATSATVITSTLPYLTASTLVEGDALYATTTSREGVGRVVRQPLAGGPLETLASGANASYSDILTAGGFLYWLNAGSITLGQGVDPNTGSVMRRALSGGTPEVVASGEDRPSGLRADGTALYWLSGTGQRVSLRSAPLAGGPARSLATELDEPSPVLPHGNDLFFLDGLNILRISRDGGPLYALGYELFPTALTVDETHVYWSANGQVRRARKDLKLEPNR